MSEKFEYDPMQQYVEKERTRTLIIEATAASPISAYMRQVIVIGFLSLGIAGYLGITKTQRGRDFLDTMNRDPLREKRAAARPRVPRFNEDPDKLVEGAHEAWAQQENLDKAKHEQGPNDAAGQAAAMTESEGLPQDLLNSQKTREALGKQLEAVGEGRAPPPSAAAVTAAMEGKAMPPPQQNYGVAPAQNSGSQVHQARAGAPDAIEGIEPELEYALPATLEQITDEPLQPLPTLRGPAQAAIVVPVPVAAVALPYRQLTQLPEHYAGEKKEFPDLP